MSDVEKPRSNMSLNTSSGSFDVKSIFDKHEAGIDELLLLVIDNKLPKLQGFKLNINMQAFVSFSFSNRSRMKRSVGGECHPPNVQQKAEQESKTGLFFLMCEMETS